MKSFIVLIIISILILSSCQYRDSSGISDIISAYQTFQDSLSSAEKGKWKVETDSTRIVKKDFYSKLINELIGLDTSNLTVEDGINKDLLLLELENELNDLNFEAHLLPLNSEGGFLTGIIYSLQYERTNSSEEKKNYIEKLKELPSYLAKHQKLMKAGMAKGKTSPVKVTQRCIDLLLPYGVIDPDNNIFVNPCGENDSLRNVAKSIIQQEVIPSYKKFTQFLQSEYLPSCKSEPGISELAGGKEYYERKTLYFTTLNMTPDEIFTRGESEVERIRNEMVNVMISSGFKGSLTSFINFLRTDKQFYAKTPRELLYRATWLAKKIEGKLPQYFTKLPRMPFTVEEVPPSIAPNYTGGRYSEGSYETGKAGAYWVNTYKLESRPLYMLPSLTLHEAVPGHHLQIMLSQELKNIPKFRENLYISAFGEGWGLYSEYLGKEMGIYETPYEDFGRLTYEMWRACRLVIDVGLHYKGWSRDRAVSYMASNTALSMHEVNTEIDRYIGWPAQAVSYKIGELKIRELRKEAEVVLGDRFDIKSFHDLILSHGSIKLSTLDKIVRLWIEELLSEKNKKD